MDSKYVAPIISTLNPYAGLGYLAYQSRDRINGWGQQLGEYGQGALNAVGGFLGGLGRYIRPQFGYGSQIGAGPTYGPSVSSDRGLGLSQTLGSQMALLEYMAAQQNRPYQIER